MNAALQPGIAQDHMEQGAERDHRQRQPDTGPHHGFMVPEHQSPRNDQKYKGQKIKAIAHQPLRSLAEHRQHSPLHAQHAKEQEQCQKRQHQSGDHPSSQTGLRLLRQHLRFFLFGFRTGPLGSGFRPGGWGCGSFRHADASFGYGKREILPIRSKNQATRLSSRDTIPAPQQ